MFDIKQYTKNFFLLDNKECVEKWKKVFDQMAVHTRKRKPEDLLLKARPNEEPHVLAYRLENYRAITYGSMNRAMDSAGRILQASQYQIECDDNVKEYLKKRQFDDNNTTYDFFNYFEKIVFKRDIEDPNGFLVWLPTGPGVEDDGQPVAPKPYFFCLDQVHDSSPEVCSFLSDEINPIKVQGAKDFPGKVYYIITRDTFYKFIQVSVDKRVKYKLQEVYQHNIGEVPAIVMGGDKNAEGYFESFFAPYCAFGDEAISTFSDWQAIKVTSGYPYREEFYEECEIKRPSKSSNPVSKSEQKYKKESTYEKFSRTPYNTIIRKIAGNKSDSEIDEERILPADIPSIRFISPDPEVLKYIGESWKDLIVLAEDALHLNLANGTNQSGVAKERDLEQERAMVDKIGNNYFNHLMYNSLKFIDCYINMKTYEKSNVVVNTPITFIPRTEGELMEEITKLKSGNAPSVLIFEATNDLAKRRFAGNPYSKKIFELITILDPLYIYDNNQKLSMMNSGGISKEAYTTSIYAYPVLKKISGELKDFLKADVEKIRPIFEEQISEYVVEEIPLTDPAGNPV